MAQDCQAGHDNGIGTALCNVPGPIGQAAAFVGAQGDDLLAAHVTSFQESEHAHGRSAAPAREADKNRIVTGNIYSTLDGWAGICCLSHILYGGRIYLYFSFLIFLYI